MSTYFKFFFLILILKKIQVSIQIGLCENSYFKKIYTILLYLKLTAIRRRKHLFFGSNENLTYKIISEILKKYTFFLRSMGEIFYTCLTPTGPANRHNKIIRLGPCIFHMSEPSRKKIKKN